MILTSQLLLFFSLFIMKIMIIVTYKKTFNIHYKCHLALKNLEMKSTDFEFLSIFSAEILRHFKHVGFFLNRDARL